MESEFVGLSLDEEEEEILQVQVDPESVREEEALSLVGCFLTASIIHYPAMKSTMANLWHPVRGVQIRDLWEKKAIMTPFVKQRWRQVLKLMRWDGICLCVHSQEEPKNE
ncbi:hypothetical protein Gotur_018067 [Gossypium turneri]